MKIVYYTERDKSIYIQLRSTTYTLCSGETLDVENDEQNDVMQIYTRKIAELNVWSTVILLLRRIIVNVFNVIIMNFSFEWFKGLDPFILSATYKVGCQKTILRYIPTRISKEPMLVKKPQIMINDKVIDAQIEFDSNSVKIVFVKYCFDLASLWVYCSMFITLIFVFSGKFSELIIVFVAILLGITIPLIFKIVKTYKEKQRLINFFS